MDQKPVPIVAGLGGAALVAAVLSIGGHSSSGVTETQPANLAVAEKSSSGAVAFTDNQEGPWYAFCQEYATTEFDHGEDPSHEWGISGHHVPPEADEGTVEITRNIPFAGSKRLETEKFNVRKHMVGDLAGCVPKGAKLRVVIAIVPDPNATQMPPEFDRDIQAIQAASTAAHYNYTRFWFPWRTNESTRDKSVDAEAEVRRREEPGILCFRKNDTNTAAGKERLFVLLVGETPTSGVNRLQLSHAFYYREQFRKANQISDADESELKIAGPHFSASFPAIQDVLLRGLYREEAKPPPTDALAPAPIPSPTFISPDASGQEFIAEFRRFCEARLPRCTLQTLSLSSGEVRSTAMDYLESLGYSQQRIAQLSEDESAFGGSELYPLGPTKDQKHWFFTDPKHAYGLSLHFPRDLSSVRSLSDEESAKVAESGSKYIGLPNGLLPTQLTVREPIDSDTPAAFGRRQEAGQVARSLDDVVQQMRTHRIRAVVISASNPLDRIYLLEYLHNQLPDVRAVTVDADELELDRPHLVDLTGTIAITTLPSLPGIANVIRGFPASPPMSFRSSRQEGEFLAIEMLLDPELDPNNAARQWPDPEHCYSISVVGEDGFQLIGDGRQSSDGEDPTFPCLSTNDAKLPSNDVGRLSNNTKLLPAYYTTVPDSRHGPGYFTVFLWFLGVLSSVHFFSLVQSERRKEGALSYSRRLKGGLESRRLYLLFVLNNQLLLMDLMGVRLCWAVLGSKLSSGRGWLTVIFLLLIFSLAILALLSAVFVKRFVTQIGGMGIVEKNKQELIVYMSIASLYLIWTASMIWRLPAFQKQSGVLLERVTHLNQGLSPVMPITTILLGYSLWSWMQLKRLDWTATRRIDLGLQPAMNEYLHVRVGEVTAGSDALSPQEQVVQLASLGLVVLLAVFLRDSLDGFDGPWFHLWMVIWGFCMLLLTVVTACFHARSIWNKLQKLLEWLETTTMRDAFQQIGSSGLMSIKIWDLAKFERSFTVLSQTVESISALYGPTSAEACAAKGELSIFVKADSEGKQVDAGEIDSLNHVMNVGVELAVQAMEATAAPVITIEGQNELRLYLALRFVAFIRYTMLQIGTLIAFVAYGYVLAVLSIMFYAFEGRKTLGDLSLMTFVILLIWIGMMMVQFQHNGMLGRLVGSTPGETSYFQVVFHLLTVGGLPLLAIVTAQFPAVGNFMLLMFRPLLGTLR